MCADFFYSDLLVNIILITLRQTIFETSGNCWKTVLMYHNLRNTKWIFVKFEICGALQNCADTFQICLKPGMNSGPFTQRSPVLASYA